MTTECEVGEGREKKVWERGKCCVALQTSLQCSPAKEVSPSQASLSLPHNDNELVPYNDGLVPNNAGQVPNNDELVPNNDKQVPNDKNQCLIMMKLWQVIGKQAW